MVKEKNTLPLSNKNKIRRFIRIHIYLSVVLIISFCIIILVGIYNFENTYSNKIYPGVRIDGLAFGGKTADFIENYYQQKSEPLNNLAITLNFESKIATLTASQMAVSFDSKLSAIQAFSIGRSGHLLSDIYQKWKASTTGINLSSVLRINTEYINEVINSLSADIDIPAQNALFQFEKGKVMVFKPSKEGRRLNIDRTKKMVLSYITSISQQENSSFSNMDIDLPVETVYPTITTENSNNFGIKDLLGVGTSKFLGSIPGRVYNIELAASRINGQLIAPGAIFSFNNTLGDVSAGTGFQPAYIIKGGRTVLGDGGGVCQVSTTLFRAALNAGLPITERYAHSYRVSYYEQDSSPGLDATVFAPSYDLKIKNDTPNYLLIQVRTDTQNYTLTFEIYGTNDNRKTEITKPVIFSQTPPPSDLYQDEPTLAKGIIKQVDWKAWGAKVNFDYKVTKNGETINQQSFYSNFQPWQAVFLRGTRE